MDGKTKSSKETEKNGLVSRPGVEVLVRHHVDRPHQGIHPSIVVKDPNNQCLFGVPITGLSLGSCLRRGTQPHAFTVRIANYQDW